MSQPSEHLWLNRGFIYLILGSTLFSLKGILIKLAYAYQVDTTVLITLRMLFSLPVYLLVLAVALKKDDTSQLTVKHLLLISVLGVFGYYFASWLDLKALNFLPANVGRLILYTYPVFVVLLSVIVLRKPFRRPVIIALFVIYLGLMLVLAPPLWREAQSIWSSDFFIGVLLTLGSGFSYAIYLLGADYFTGKVSSRLFTSVAISAASVAILSHYFLVYPLNTLLHQPWQVYIYGLAIAVFATLLPSFLIASGIQRIGAEMGSAVTTVSPLISLIFAYFVLGETLSFMQMTGFLVVILAVYKLTRLKFERG